MTPAKTHPNSKDCKKTRAHFVYDVKHDGGNEARLVPDGNLTNFTLRSICPGAVSLRAIRLVLFIYKLNGLESWGADTRNAFLEDLTK